MSLARSLFTERRSLDGSLASSMEFLENFVSQQEARRYVGFKISHKESSAYSPTIITLHVSRTGIASLKFAWCLRKTAGSLFLLPMLRDSWRGRAPSLSSCSLPLPQVHWPFEVVHTINCTSPTSASTTALAASLRNPQSQPFGM